MRQRQLLLVVSILSVILSAVVFFPSAESAVFPEKGRTITFIVNQPAGGPSDIASRVLAGAMEKELGVPVAVVIPPAGAGPE